MPILVIVLGFIYFIVNVVREWSTPIELDNAMAINGYASTATFGLFLMLGGIVWKMLRR